MFIDTPDGIRRFQLLTQRQAVRLEQLGMKHSGGNITPKLKRHYHLSRQATYQQVIAAINADLDQLAEHTNTTGGNN